MKRLLLLIVFVGMLYPQLFSQKTSNKINEKIDTRIDNMGYWMEKAKEGLVPYNPKIPVKPAIYKGSSINVKGIKSTKSTDVPVTNLTDVTQSENSVFVDPNDFNYILNSNNSTSWDGSSAGSLYGADYLQSADGGATFGGSVQGAGGSNSGDPAAAINLSGRQFVGYISSSGGMGVSYSDNGSAWTAKTVYSTGSQDKNHLWVDNSSSSPYEGNLYNVWTDFSGGSNDKEILFSRSTDNGNTWSAAINISSAVNAGSHNQGVNVQTGPNGEVYVIWTIYDSWPSDEAAIGMAKSTNGGVSFASATRIISNIRGIRDTGVPQNMRVNSFPVCAVDISSGANSGNVYVIWTNIGTPGTNSGTAGVYIIRSTNGGGSWSSPVKVNQGTGTAYQPWITCDPSSGTLAVVFYDNRNTATADAEAWASYSTDAGNTWTDFRVSDVSFTPSPIPGLASGYMGDYLGITSNNGKFYPCWTDNRNGQYMTYVSPFEIVLTADFSGIPTSVNVGNTVTFTDGSFGPNTITSWNWSFPGGTPSSYSGQNPPPITYNSVGTYDVTLTVGDGSTTDVETKTGYISVFDCTVSSFPYTQNFDSWSTSSPAYQCTADGSVTLQDCWTNVTGDDIDWDILSGSTGSSSTGPSSDHTTGSGNYLYTESSSCYSSTGFITSPTFNLGSFTSASLTFWYHMYGAAMGTMSVQVSTDGGSTWSSDIWTKSGDQGNSWQQATVLIDSYISSNTVIRFAGLTGSSYTSDMAIDDVTVDGSSAGPANDNCSGAIAINEVNDMPFNTSTATASGVNLSCVNGTQVDLWYAYTATFTGDATFDLCGSGYDTGLGIWDACGGTQLDCNDDNGPACSGTQSSITMAVTSGTTYYVQVAGYNGATGNGDLTIRPANDNCSGATAISEVTDLPFNTNPATASGTNLSCVTGTMVDLWYAYTASISGTATFDLCGSVYDTGLGIWDACGGTEIACNDDACGLQSSITMAVTSGTTYYVQVAGYNGATGNGDLTIQVVVPGLWTGNTSTDWSASANWDDSNVPAATIDVTIPVSPTGGNYPETNSGSNAECANLTIESGAHLFIPSNNTLTVNGTLTNNAGTSGLVIVSDANGTGSLIHNTSGIDATVERYLTDARWHFVGMPVNSATAGVFHLTSGHSDIYLRTHIEANNTWDSYIVPVTTPLVLGRGYETWVGTPGGFSQPETVEFAGVLNNGDYTTGAGSFYGLQYTSGHGLNMISNPYPSALEADIDTWSKNNIANSVWIWSDAAGNYVYWNGTDGTNSNGWGTMTGGIIPEMQGFFVLATGTNPWLTIPQSNRLHSSQAFYKESEVPENTLKLKVANGEYEDIVFVTFNSQATDGFDAEYDVQKLYGLPEAPQLYSVIPNKQLSINSLPELTESETVQLGFECGVEGVFTIQADELESFIDYTPVYLEDTKEGTIQKLNDNPVYIFNHSPLDDNNRFVLHFGEVNGIGDISTGGVNVYSNKSTVYIQKPADFTGNISIFDMLGQEIITQKANSEGLMSIPVTNGTGYYVVKVQSDNSLVTRKVFIK